MRPPTAGLSPRLAVVAELVLPGEPVADIGTDHGLVPRWLVSSDRVPRVIATDARPGPLAQARAAVADHADAVELRQGSGLSVLAPGEVATVVIAGMGGRLVRQIVDADLDRLVGARRLVLQPMDAWEDTRRWIGLMPWTLVDEVLVEDGGHHYLVLALDLRQPAMAPTWDETDLALGPFIRRRAGPVFVRHLRREHERIAAARAAASRARDPLDPRPAALERRLCMVASELARVGG